MPLLAERARLKAFLKQWPEAEADLRDLLRLLPIEEDYRYFGEGHLLLGFVRHAQGDVDGARKIWAEGTHPRWLEWYKRTHGKDHSHTKLFVGTQFITHILQCSLSGSLTKADADDLISHALDACAR